MLFWWLGSINGTSTLETHWWKNHQPNISIHCRNQLYESILCRSNDSNHPQKGWTMGSQLNNVWGMERYSNPNPIHHYCHRGTRLGFLWCDVWLVWRADFVMVISWGVISQKRDQRWVFSKIYSHLSRTRNFTSRKDKTSLMRSFGRTTSDGDIDVADCILQYEQIRCGSNLKWLYCVYWPCKYVGDYIYLYLIKLPYKISRKKLLQELCWNLMKPWQCFLPCLHSIPFNLYHVSLNWIACIAIIVLVVGFSFTQKYTFCMKW